MNETPLTTHRALGLAVALGLGLLLGLERERRKGDGEGRASAGIRTFGLVALLGGLCASFGAPLLVAGVLFIGAAALVAYATGDRSDPGLTSEVALVVAFVLGALAQREPQLATAVGVTATALLALRAQLHRIVRQALTDHEVLDGLMLAVAALVVLPLVPHRALGPFGVINPFRVWRLVVIVMAIGAAGYVALRVLGPRLGLALSGLASGFVSSTATIAAMGVRARAHPALERSAVAGAVLSTVATMAQLALVLGATSAPTLARMAVPLAAGGAVATGYGVVFALRAARRDGAGAGGAERKEAPASGEDAAAMSGRSVDLKSAVFFAALVTLTMLLGAALHAWFGPRGLVVATGASGLADAHSAAASAASLVASGRIEPRAAEVPILVAVTTNSVSKAVMATVNGTPLYRRQVITGLVLVLAAVWAAWLVTRAG